MSPCVVMILTSASSSATSVDSCGKLAFSLVMASLYCSRSFWASAASELVSVAEDCLGALEDLVVESSLVEQPVRASADKRLKRMIFFINNLSMHKFMNYCYFTISALVFQTFLRQ